MGLIVNDSESVDVSGLNSGTSIRFEDGREIKIFTLSEAQELIDVLQTIVDNGHLL
jgi:hypothetical protein